MVVMSSEGHNKITQEDIEGILQKFTGNIMQVPPLLTSVLFQDLLVLLIPSVDIRAVLESRDVTFPRIAVKEPVQFELSSCANVLELTRTKQGPFTLEEHALPEDRWTIDDIAQSLEQCSSLLPAEMALKKSKPEESSEQVLSCEYITLSEIKGEDDVIKTF
ncbi:putative tRNA pseudouridine synthase 1, partial [Eschrichtius robustus]|nr:putative tRNA pseudouridine synthase 1 [Eschrichtius robustus]